MLAGRDVAAGLSRSFLFEGLTPAQLAPLAAVVSTRSYVRGEYIWRAGEPAEEICVVLEGQVKDSVVDADGFEVVHFIHGPGMTIGVPGFFAVDRYRVVDDIALAPTVLIRMHRRELQPFIEQHPTIKDRALEGLASNTRWQSTMIASLFRRSLTDRVGLRLLELVDSGGERSTAGPMTPKVSQSTLAAMIGVSRENVNRALAALVSDGFVRLEKGRYVIVDEDGLRRRMARDWPMAQRRDRRQV